ncbi:MAG: hypothetical protein ABNH38_16105 [Tateyamaria sp.]|jgi:TPR repeat protein|uniref:SEL1-like repeat protein n=1 Tax=Tateyamaria sp. TaxID=1929288 RepID=UPI0032DDE700
MVVRKTFAVLLGASLLGFFGGSAYAQTNSAGSPFSAKWSDNEAGETYRRAEALRYGKDVERDAQESIRLHGMLADQGYAPSIFRLAEFHYWGRDIQRDKQRAVQLFQEAADLGYDLALVSLGRALSDLGRKKEALAAYQRAIELEAKDAELRFAIAQLRGDFGDLAEPSQGFPDVTRYADEGNSRAMLALADAYRDGRGTESDPEKSFELVKKVAETGNAYATRLLGQFYEEGVGTKADPEAAVETYRRAIQLGHDYAWVRLGLILMEEGRLEEAKMALEQGAALGAYSGELTLAKAHYEERLGEVSDRSFGAGEIARLAEAGDVQAARALLVYHERRSRRINEVDLELVLDNMTAATAKGDPWATEALLRFYRKLRWLIPEADKKRAQVFEDYGHQLRTARFVPEELWLKYDRNRPSASMREVAEIVSDYEDENFYYGMLELLYIDRNAYTYALQSELIKAGLFSGRPTGKMSGETIQSVLNFCRDIGTFDECVHGPLLFSNAKLVVDGLNRRR